MIADRSSGISVTFPPASSASNSSPSKFNLTTRHQPSSHAGLLATSRRGSRRLGYLMGSGSWRKMSFRPRSSTRGAGAGVGVGVGVDAAASSYMSDRASMVAATLERRTFQLWSLLK
jgi:hypothetical protein